MTVKKDTSAGRVRRAEILKKRSQKYVLKLYVAGANRKSAEAIRNITEICDKHLKGRYKLEIIYIHQAPVMLQEAQIIAAPTLIRKFPLPLKRLIGSMANQDKVLMGLDLRPLL